MKTVANCLARIAFKLGHAAALLGANGVTYTPKTPTPKQNGIEVVDDGCVLNVKVFSDGSEYISITELIAYLQIQIIETNDEDTRASLRTLIEVFKTRKQIPNDRN